MYKKYDGGFNHSPEDGLFPWLALVRATILVCVGLEVGKGRFPVAVHVLTFGAALLVL
jgi:hypothetical protein